MDFMPSVQDDAIEGCIKCAMCGSQVPLDDFQAWRLKRESPVFKRALANALNGFLLNLLPLKKRYENP